jgi:hypothetical protein
MNVGFRSVAELWPWVGVTKPPASNRRAVSSDAAMGFFLGASFAERHQTILPLYAPRYNCQPVHAFIIWVVEG